MKMNHLVLTGTLALSLLGASMASANPPNDKIVTPMKNHQLCHCHKKTGNMLNKQQRQGLHTIMRDSRGQAAPLLQKKRTLRLQLMGKLATPGTQWNDITPLIKRINENNAKITELFAKTRLKTFQEVGVLPPHGKYTHHHSRSF